MNFRRNCSYTLHATHCLGTNVLRVILHKLQNKKPSLRTSHTLGTRLNMRISWLNLPVMLSSEEATSRSTVISDNRLTKIALRTEDKTMHTFGAIVWRESFIFTMVACWYRLFLVWKSRHFGNCAHMIYSSIDKSEVGVLLFVDETILLFIISFPAVGVVLRTADIFFLFLSMQCSETA